MVTHKISVVVESHEIIVTILLSKTGHGVHGIFLALTSFLALVQEECLPLVLNVGNRVL